MAALYSSTDDSDSDAEFEFQLGIVALAGSKKRKRKCWTRKWVSRRNELGAYSALLQELLTEEDERASTSFLRMAHGSFMELLEMVGPSIQKKDTVMRQSIPPGERLAITLRYLGSGNTFTDLMFLFRVPDNTIHGIVMETCEAIYKVLKAKYLKVPTTADEWQRISRQFEEKWNLPNCIGAMDGKHIRINAPGPGSTHFNYKGYHSIILLAVVDATYKFLFVDVGANGRAGDAAVFRESTLQEHLQSKSLGIPEPRPLPGRTDPVPFFLVGDDAFPLKTYLMKPYPFRYVRGEGTAEELEEERKKQRIYDYRHSRARRVSENGFGILAARFGVFQHAFRQSPDKVKTITLACLALHNFLMSKHDRVFAPQALPDREDPTSHEMVPGSWRQTNQSCFEDLQSQTGIRTASDARAIRNELKEYVNCEGQVCWQEQLVFGDCH